MMSRTIVITGGTSGIGLALKELFEKNGDKVVTFSIDESANAEHYQGSVTHEIKVNQVFNDIHEKHGNIDMLINCAGFGMSAITEIAPMEKINAVMDVNFYGTLYCTRAALRYMNAGSKIVNLSSAMALFPVPFKSIYGAAKSAVLNMSFAMRMELAPAGIDVVAICPGDTKTNFTKNRIKEFETTERYGDRLKTSTEHNDSKENKRMSVSYVANQIYKVVNKAKTKPFYIVGGKYKFLYFLTRLTPKSLLINMTGKKLGGKMESVPTKKVAEPVSVENTYATQEEAPVMQEAAMSVAMSSETQEAEVAAAPAEEVSEEVAAEVVATEEPATETVSQEEAKNNISNILNKITILNKPSEQVAKVEEEAEPNEQVVEETTNAFVVESAEEPEVVVSVEEMVVEPETTVVEEAVDMVEEPQVEMVEEEEEPVVPVLEEESIEEEVAPVVFEEETTEQETPAEEEEEVISAATSVFAAAEPVEEETEEVVAPVVEETTEEAVNPFARFNTMVEETSVEEPSAVVFEEEPVEEVVEEQVEEVEESAPVEETPRTFGNFDALRQSISNMQRPATPVVEPEATPVVAFDDAEEEETINASTSVFATAELPEEPVTTNIQFDDEDNRFN